MKKIPLTQGQVALVDDEDFARFGHLKWHAGWRSSPNTFYAFRRKGSVSVSLHQEIIGVSGRKIRVDHKNHNGLDCRRSRNLRVCTHAQNMMNRGGLNANNKSGIRGVSWDKKNCKWRANICLDGKTKTLGRFSNKSVAAAAYAAANRQHFGEFGGKF